MACPNISSPEWKALVSKIGETNAWKEFIAFGNIPNADNYKQVDFPSTGLKKYSVGYNSQKEYYLAKNIKSLLNDIVKFTENKDSRLLSEAILKIPNIERIKLNVLKYDKDNKEIPSIDKNKYKGALVLGNYNSFDELISIIGNLEKNTFETVFLHEMVHGITVNEYYNNKEFSNKIDTLYNYALKFKNYNTSNKVKLGEMYGMTNPKEFMSEAMSNPDFIFELSKYYSPIYEKSKSKNIFQEFIDLIVNLLKEKLSIKGKKYIDDNLGETVLKVISNYANIPSSKFNSLNYSVKDIEETKKFDETFNNNLNTFKSKLIDIIGKDKIKELYADTDVKFNSFIIDEVELGTDKDLIITIKTDKDQRTAFNLKLDGDYQRLKISEGKKTIRNIYAPLSEKNTAIDFLINEFKNTVSKTTETIKPGVEELFDSNPELANQVYEALGFIKGKKTEFTNDEAQSIVNQWKANAVTLRGKKPSGSQLGELDNAADALLKKLLSLKGEKFTKAPTKATLINDLFDRTKDRQVDLSEESPVSDLLNLATRFFNGGLYNDDITPQQKQQALQLYSSYLDTIFPESKIKEIVYHGAMEQLIPKDGKFKGYVTYFSTVKKYAETFGFPVNRKIVQAVINISKPYNSPSELADVPKEVHDSDQFTNPRIIKSNNSNYDSVIGIDAGQKEGNTIAVFEPEQIHILGSKSDVKGFKEYVKNPTKTFEKDSGIKILDSLKNLNLSEQEIDNIYENYVNLMDRKREGKAISKEMFIKASNNLQVFKSKNTYILGEWDMKNNIFKGRVMSSPNIRELYTELDNLINTVDFMASVPEDIGKMLTKKGMYKLNVDKEYNFRGEEMIKNLYFSNKDLAEKIFKTKVENITEEQIKKYDKFYNYYSLISDFIVNYLKYNINNTQKLNPKKDVSIGFLEEVNNLLNKKNLSYDNINYIKAILSNLNIYIKEQPSYKKRSSILIKIFNEINKIESDIKNSENKYTYNTNKELTEEIKKEISSPLDININKEDLNFNKNPNFFDNLKELGMYDYNAYQLHKKIKKNKISEVDKKSIIDNIIKNSTLNKINIDKTDLLNNPKIYNQLNNDLNKTLARFLSKFGIKTELLENLQDELNVDSLAFANILKKIVYTDKNNQEDYPQQAGKIIAFMMQHNPLVAEITSSMKRQSMFENLNNDELLGAVGDLISQELHKKTNTDLPKSLLDSIKLLIKQFFDFINVNKIARINKNISYIVDNILIENQSLITQSIFKPGAENKPVAPINLEEALASDKFGNDIVEKMSEYFILTGSITLSEQGSVLRPSENQIHDLDWVSSYLRNDSIKIFNKLYPNNEYVRNITNEDYQTDTWLIVPEGYSIKNLNIDKSIKTLKDGKKGATNKILGYDIANSEGNIVSSYIPETDSHTGEIVAKLIDIFSYQTNIEEKTAHTTITLNSGTKLRIADWQNTFGAKLDFGRLKDIWDYNRFIPLENIYSPEELGLNTEISQENFKCKL
jgi:hypothetical protein